MGPTSSVFHPLRALLLQPLDARAARSRRERDDERLAAPGLQMG
jgi:hypothetical protein